MKVEDIVRVVGRGYIVCSHLDNEVIHIGDIVKAGNTEFRIRGIEKWQYSKAVGLLMSPNDLVPEHFGIGDKIVIINEL